MKNIIANSKYNFTSDVVNIITLIYDTSGSMCDDEYAICAANDAFKEDFSKFEEKNAIVIARCDFDSEIRMSNFLPVEFFSTKYSTGGQTNLYKAISTAATVTIAYYDELVKRLNIQPRITFLVFSDGVDNCGGSYAFHKAIEDITQLNKLNATTVFVAFRDAIPENSGEKLGFNCTRNISNVQELISCLGMELSQSCKEQSKSAYSLKSSFFDQAAPAATGNAKDENVLSDDFFKV